MENSATHQQVMNAQKPESAEYAKMLSRAIRWGAWIAILLIGLWLWEKLLYLGEHRFPWLVWVDVAYAITYGIWMVFPWVKQSPPVWKFGMTGYLVMSFFFVFLLIGNIMVDASAAGAAGERLGVPGMEGAIMFLCLAQIPGILFERHPEMMN